MFSICNNFKYMFFPSNVAFSLRVVGQIYINKCIYRISLWTAAAPLFESSLVQLTLNKDLKTALLKLLLEQWAQHIACGYPS